LGSVAAAARYLIRFAVLAGTLAITQAAVCYPSAHQDRRRTIPGQDGGEHDRDRQSAGHPQTEERPKEYEGGTYRQHEYGNQQRTHPRFESELSAHRKLRTRRLLTASPASPRAERDQSMVALCSPARVNQTEMRAIEKLKRLARRAPHGVRARPPTRREQRRSDPD
jgi:hypothetical protein